MADEQTLGFYEQHAGELSGKYNAIHPAHIKRICGLARPGGRVLDVGCGSGRDLAAFHHEGMDVTGIEPVAAFRAAAESSHPVLRGRIHAGSLPDGIPSGLGTFDLVNCSAVLMHLPTEQLSSAIRRICELVNSNGLVNISFCPLRPGVDADSRAPEGRLFNPIDPDRVVHLLELSGFEILDRRTSSDALDRPGICWISLVARRKNGPVGA